MPPRKPRTPPVELASLPAVPPAGPRLAAGVDPEPGPASVSSFAREIRAERDIEDVMSEVGGSDVTVKVMRRGDNGAMYACGTMAADTFTVEALTDAYGGGSYQLRFMRGRSELERATVEVDPLIPAKNPRAPKPLPGAPVPVASSQNPDMMASVVAMMGTMMTSMMTSTQALVATMAEANKLRPQERDVVGEFVKMAEVLKPSGPATPVSEAFSIFERGLKLGRGENGGDSDSVMPAITEGIKTVGALAQAALEEKRGERGARGAAPVAAASVARPAGAAEPTPAPAVVGDVALAAAPEPVTTEPVMSRLWQQAAAPYKGMLITMVGKVQPENAAAMILDVLDDDQLSDLAADIESDGPEAFAARSVAVFGVRESDTPWLAQLAAAVLEQSEADGEPDEPGPVS